MHILNELQNKGSGIKIGIEYYFNLNKDVIITAANLLLIFASHNFTKEINARGIIFISLFYQVKNGFLQKFYKIVKVEIQKSCSYLLKFYHFCVKKFLAMIIYWKELRFLLL